MDSPWPILHVDMICFAISIDDHSITSIQTPDGAVRFRGRSTGATLERHLLLRRSEPDRGPTTVTIRPFA